MSVLSLERPDTTCSRLQVYCIDNSEYALRSEDYPINRLHFQHSALQSVNRSLGLCKQAPLLYAAIHNGRKIPEFIVPPTSDDTSLVKSISLGNEGAQEHKFVQSLKIAALACKQYAAAQIIACIASPIHLPPEERHQLVQNLTAADVRLDLLQLCADEELGWSVVTELKQLIAGLNTSPNGVNEGGVGFDARPSTGTEEGATAAGAAAAAVGSRPSRLIKLQPPDFATLEWQQHERLLEMLEFGSSDQVGATGRFGCLNYMAAMVCMPCTTVGHVCSLCQKQSSLQG
jgi:hypothetical protein